MSATTRKDSSCSGEEATKSEEERHGLENGNNDSSTLAEDYKLPVGARTGRKLWRESKGSGNSSGPQPLSTSHDGPPRNNYEEEQPPPSKGNKENVEDTFVVEKSIPPELEEERAEEGGFGENENAAAQNNNDIEGGPHSNELPAEMMPSPHPGAYREGPGSELSNAPGEDDAPGEPERPRHNNTQQASAVELLVATVVEPNKRTKRIIFLMCIIIIVLVAVAVAVPVAWALTAHPSDPSQALSLPQPPCVSDRYYLTYNWGSKIGFVDTVTNSTVHEVCRPDCTLHFLAFDSAGTAHGVCWVDGSYSLVTVDLQSGNTTELAKFPSRRYRGLAYNPVDGHFYTTLHNEDGSFSLVKIEDNWTFLAHGSASPSLPAKYYGFAIDARGNAFGSSLNPAKLFSVNLMTGASVDLGSLPGDTGSLAFDGRNSLHGVEYHGSMFIIDVSGTTFTTTSIKETDALFSFSSAFCPL